MKKFLFRFIYWIIGAFAFYFVVYYPESFEQSIQWNFVWRSALASLFILGVGLFIGNKFKSK